VVREGQRVRIVGTVALVRGVSPESKRATGALSRGGHDPGAIAQFLRYQSVGGTLGYEKEAKCLHFSLTADEVAIVLRTAQATQSSSHSQTMLRRLGCAII